MDWQGKKINFLGDSITYGAGVADRENNVFPARLKRMLSLAEARNYGVNGTRIAPRKEPLNASWDSENFIARAARMDPDADGVVVLGGTNDFGHGDAPLGAPGDRTTETFYGSLHVLMQTLIGRYPGKMILFLTPLHRRLENDPWGDRKEDGTPYKKYPDHPLVDYVQAIRETAEYYSLPVLDLWAMSGLQPAVPEIKAQFMPDALHPNDAGQELLAERIAGFLRAY